MPTERLYYTDAYMVDFDALVLDVVKQDDRWQVTLDRTAFYPTSGGQPFDTGSLGDAQVVEVVDREDGSVGHLVDREIEKHSRVHGRIDWTRRFDHMQQHSGQHLLSAAFEHEAGAKTVSFHLGASSATIDLDKELSADQILRVEETANEVLWEDREVGTRFVSASEAATLPLRKEPARSGDLRIIEIKDYDLSACGGTHVRRTGVIGMVAIAGFERFKGGLRVEFVCGQRALRAYRALKSSVVGSVRLLSVLPDELPGAIERLQLSSKSQQKSREALQARLADHEAAALVLAGEKYDAATVVAALVTDWDANGLKRLASAVTTNPGIIAVLLTSEAPSLMVVARSQDLMVDTGVVLRKVLERFGGKGGGKGAMAQGGGLIGDAQEILECAAELIKSIVRSP